MIEIQTKIGKFEFCEEPHGYFLNGKKLDNTTSIMDAAGITDYSKANPDDLEAARVKGQAVHLAIEWLEHRVDHEPLHPIVQAHVDQYVKFKHETGFEAVVVEMPLLCHAYGYATKVDLIGKYFGNWVIAEIKTSAYSAKHTPIQTAAQLLAFKAMKNLGFYPDIPENLHRHSLEIYEDRFKMSPPFLKEDLNISVFLSALWVTRYKRGDYAE